MGLHGRVWREGMGPGRRGLTWQVLRFVALKAPPLPCDRRSLLSLGPSSRSWLGRLSE